MGDLDDRLTRDWVGRARQALNIDHAVILEVEGEHERVTTGVAGAALHDGLATLFDRAEHAHLRDRLDVAHKDLPRDHGDAAIAIAHAARHGVRPLVLDHVGDGREVRVLKVIEPVAVEVPVVLEHVAPRVRRLHDQLEALPLVDRLGDRERPERVGVADLDGRIADRAAVVFVTDPHAHEVATLVGERVLPRARRLVDDIEGAIIVEVEAVRQRVRPRVSRRDRELHGRALKDGAAVLNGDNGRRRVDDRDEDLVDGLGAIVVAQANHGAVLAVVGVDVLDAVEAEAFEVPDPVAFEVPRIGDRVLPRVFGHELNRHGAALEHRRRHDVEDLRRDVAHEHAEAGLALPAVVVRDAHAHLVVAIFEVTVRQAVRAHRELVILAVAVPVEVKDERVRARLEHAHVHGEQAALVDRRVGLHRGDCWRDVPDEHAGVVDVRLPLRVRDAHAELVHAVVIEPHDGVGIIGVIEGAVPVEVPRVGELKGVLGVDRARGGELHRIVLVGVVRAARVCHGAWVVGVDVEVEHRAAVRVRHPEEDLARHAQELRGLGQAIDARGLDDERRQERYRRARLNDDLPKVPSERVGRVDGKPLPDEGHGHARASPLNDRRQGLHAADRERVVDQEPAVGRLDVRVVVLRAPDRRAGPMAEPRGPGARGADSH